MTGWLAGWLAGGPGAKSNGRSNGCFKAPKTISLSDPEHFTPRPGKDESTEVELRSTKYTLLDVFRNFRLAMYTLCMSFLWCARWQFSKIRVTRFNALHLYGRYAANIYAYYYIVFRHHLTLSFQN